MGTDSMSTITHQLPLLMNFLDDFISNIKTDKCKINPERTSFHRNKVRLQQRTKEE
jgi:hypothetical protein